MGDLGVFLWLVRFSGALFHRYGYIITLENFSELIGPIVQTIFRIYHAGQAVGKVDKSNKTLSYAYQIRKKRKENLMLMMRN